MTLALITFIAFCIVSSIDSTKRKSAESDSKKRTITNVALQDSLFQENFSKVIRDLERMDKVTPLKGETLIDALEFLFELYVVPDERDDAKKAEDRAKYLRCITKSGKPSDFDDFEYYDDDDYIDDRKLNLYQRIYLKKTAIPHITQPNLLFGTRNTAITVDGFKYEYDYRGFPKIYHVVPAHILGNLVVMLTTRDLKAQGFNYSWDRQESDWQRLEIKRKEYLKKKEKYPWLYD